MNASQVRAHSYRVLHALELLRAEIASEKEDDRKTAALDLLDAAEQNFREAFQLLLP